MKGKSFLSLSLAMSRLDMPCVFVCVSAYLHSLLSWAISVDMCCHALHQTTLVSRICPVGSVCYAVLKSIRLALCQLSCRCKNEKS